MNYCKTHPDLVDLCTNCGQDNCPDGGCKQYKELEQKLSGKPRRKKTLENAVMHGTSDLLLKITSVINALDELLADKNCDHVYSVVKIERLANELKAARNVTYGHLINWNDIASKIGGKK